MTEHADEDQLFEDDIYPFVLVLWNDEQHSFNEVISQVDEALACGRISAKHVAETVDVHVRLSMLIIYCADFLLGPRPYLGRTEC